MTEKKAGAKQGGRFQPGKRGNAVGRPRGLRNSATLAVEVLLDGQARQITKKAIDLALAGDTVALRLCLERILPPRKDRPVSLRLAKIERPADAMRAMSEILEAVTNGDISPAEAVSVAGLIDTLLHAIEAIDVEQRLVALETEASRCAP